MSGLDEYEDESEMRALELGDPDTKLLGLEERLPRRMVAETFDENDISAVKDAINDSLAETLEEPVGVLDATPEWDGIEADGTALALAVAEENAELVTTLIAVIRGVAEKIADCERDARDVSEANASPDSTDEDEDVIDEIEDGDDD